LIEVFFCHKSLKSHIPNGSPGMWRIDQSFPNPWPNFDRGIDLLLFSQTLTKGFGKCGDDGV
jgi:hypothetical protein